MPTMIGQIWRYRLRGGGVISHGCWSSYLWHRHCAHGLCGSHVLREDKALPAILEKPGGQRGKIAKSDARNLWERLKEYEAAVRLFAKDGNVSFTHNRAERN